MTDSEKPEIRRIALRDITYISGRDPVAGLNEARELAYGALKDSGLIPLRGHFETHGQALT